ncbi:MAG: 16S rRNA (guanine(966)-N(2))-methyltransferase RsmD [Dehalococcoidia bacterium]|nr:16S rRNA (guanine(966)-N(2))-methyltransferase RsmD [Dehalococcoidia bacterium]
MRVTSGEAKGVYLKVPSRGVVRPTTSLVKQAILSMLQTCCLNGSRILDLYAGSGALGIETISQGGGWVDFVDQNRECCRIIDDNLRRTGFLSNAHVYCHEVEEIIPKLSGRYDVVFADPPYSDTSINRVLPLLAKSDLVDRDTIIVVCHSSRVLLDVACSELELIKQRRYGDTMVSMYWRSELWA